MSIMNERLDRPIEKQLKLHCLSLLSFFGAVLGANTMKAKPLPSQEYLKECFDYNEHTGELVWKERPRHHFASDVGWKGSNSRCSGKEAGHLLKCAAGKSYRRVLINNQGYLVHRIIWKMVYGFDAVEIDHINGDGLDNRIENLRNVNRQENTINNRLYKTNKSGVVGVCWSKSSQKWHAQLNYKGQHFNLGLFTDKQDAIAARKAAEAEYNFHENHGQQRPL